MTSEGLQVVLGGVLWLIFGLGLAFALLLAVLVLITLIGMAVGWMVRVIRGRT